MIRTWLLHTFLVAATAMTATRATKSTATTPNKSFSIDVLRLHVNISSETIPPPLPLALPPDEASIETRSALDSLAFGGRFTETDDISTPLVYRCRRGAPEREAQRHCYSYLGRWLQGRCLYDIRINFGFWTPPFHPHFTQLISIVCPQNQGIFLPPLLNQC